MQNLWSRSRAGAEVAVEMPSAVGDSDYVEWWYRYILLSEAYGSAAAVVRKYMHTDIRPVLSTIHVPTLVLLRPAARGGDPAWHDASRFVAQGIPGAQLHQLPGADVSLWLGDTAAVLGAIDSFFVNVRREAAELERVLATVLFTDIVRFDREARRAGECGLARSRRAPPSRRFERSSSGSAARRSTPPATDSSPLSTARRVRFAARRRSSRRCMRSESRYERDYTRASARSSTARSAAWPSTSALASAHTPSPPRCSSRKP